MKQQQQQQQQQQHQNYIQKLQDREEYFYLEDLKKKLNMQQDQEKQFLLEMRKNQDSFYQIYDNQKRQIKYYFGKNVETLNNQQREKVKEFFNLIFMKSNKNLRKDDFLIYIQRSGIPKKIAKDFLANQQKMKNIKIIQKEKYQFIQENLDEEQKKIFAVLMEQIQETFWQKDDFMREMTKTMFANENPFVIKELLKIIQETKKEEIYFREIFGRKFIFQKKFEEEFEDLKEQFENKYLEFESLIKQKTQGQEYEIDSEILSEFIYFNNLKIQCFIKAFNSRNIQYKLTIDKKNNVKITKNWDDEILQKMRKFTEDEKNLSKLNQKQLNQLKSIFI